ncbi:MAG: hypothetical protein GX863_02635 [Firmicutes bacterium]|jgi:peptide/nickel transport system substrate-binding protein|nr:hypothetical protein [Candidatus Fermentithermobacillaceae bacterium]
MLRRIPLVLPCVVMVLSLAACSRETEPPAPPQTSGGEKPAGGIVSAKDSMVVVMPADPGSLDPHNNVAQNKHQSTRQTYETLVVYNEKGELVPWLAESWEYEDDLTLVLHIRKGVKFHNGDELKASDV